MTSDSLGRLARLALVLLLLLGVGHLLALTFLFGPFLLMATGARYGSASPMLLLVPTVLAALAAMVYALLQVVRWGSSWDVPGPNDPLGTGRQITLWAGGLSWLLWALANLQVLVAFIGDAQVRQVPAPVFMLPTLGILFGITVGALVILVLLGRLRPSGRRESGTRARSS